MAARKITMTARMMRMITGTTMAAGFTVLLIRSLAERERKRKRERERASVVNYVSLKYTLACNHIHTTT